jgi:hypothetical protein
VVGRNLAAPVRPDERQRAIARSASRPSISANVRASDQQVVQKDDQRALAAGKCTSMPTVAWNRFCSRPGCSAPPRAAGRSHPPSRAPDPEPAVRWGQLLLQRGRGQRGLVRLRQHLNHHLPERIGHRGIRGATLKLIELALDELPPARTISRRASFTRPSFPPASPDTMTTRVAPARAPPRMRPGPPVDRRPAPYRRGPRNSPPMSPPARSHRRRRPRQRGGIHRDRPVTTRALDTAPGSLASSRNTMSESTRGMPARSSCGGRGWRVRWLGPRRAICRVNSRTPVRIRGTSRPASRGRSDDRPRGSIGRCAPGPCTGGRSLKGRRRQIPRARSESRRRAEIDQANLTPDAPTTGCSRG